jgi:uncharacterized protein
MTSKIDIHLHPGEWKFLGSNVPFKKLLELLDRFEIVCGVMSHALALLSDPRAGNREVVKLCNADTRLRAYLYLNPFDPEGALEDLRTYSENPRVVGVKTRSEYHGTQMDHPGIARALEMAADLELTLLYHGSGTAADSPAALKVLERLPRLKVIWTHATWRTALELKSNPGIFFDVASSSADRTAINLEELVRLAGDDRVVFGSDAPLINPAFGMGKIDSADLTERQRQKIYFDNALRAFPRLKV